MRRSDLLATVGCGIAAAWLVIYALAHLAPTLPHRYVAVHWRIAWVGLDLGMALVALATLLLLVRRSVSAAITAAVLAGLILADAWFDCLTARAADLEESLLSLAVEIPAAMFFLWLAVHVIKRARGDTTKGQ
jgi:hypothetical protein